MPKRAHQVHTALKGKHQGQVEIQPTPQTLAMVAGRIHNMPQRHYISTDSAVLFTKGWWIDDAVGIQYQAMDPKEPLFGYRSKRWDDVADGNIMVHGMLDINFRYKGYLTILLAGVGSLRARLKKAREEGDTQVLGEYGAFQRALNPQNNLRQAAIDPTTFTATQRAQLLEASVEEFDLRRFRRLAKAMQEDFWKRNIHNSRIEKAQAERNRVGTYPDGFDIDVVFAQNEIDDLTKDQDPALVEHLIDVRIVGQSKILQNTVPGGGEPLIERYQFIAKDVV